MSRNSIGPESGDTEYHLYYIFLAMMDPLDTSQLYKLWTERTEGILSQQQEHKITLAEF